MFRYGPAFTLLVAPSIYMLVARERKAVPAAESETETEAGVAELAPAVAIQ